MPRRTPKLAEAGLTLYQLLITLVLLVIVLSLGMAYQQRQNSRPAYAVQEEPAAP